MLVKYNIGDDVYYLVSCFSISCGKITGIKGVPRDRNRKAHVEYSINGSPWMSEDCIGKDAHDILGKAYNTKRRIKDEQI